MSTFPLQIGTPDGLLFEGDVARVVCRSITGDLDGRQPALAGCFL